MTVQGLVKKQQPDGRGNEGEKDKLLLFRRRMGRALREKHKKHTFGAFWGWGIVLSEVLKENGGEWGKMEGKWGKMLVDGFTIVWFMLCFMSLCVVQLSTVYIHIILHSFASGVFFLLV